MGPPLGMATGACMGLPKGPKHPHARAHGPPHPCHGVAHFCKTGLGAKKISAPPAGIKPGKESWKGGAREKSAFPIFFCGLPETRGEMWAHSRAPVWCAPAPHEEHAKQTSGLSRWVGTTCNVDGRFGLLLPKGTQDMPAAPENYQKKNKRSTIVEPPVV